MNRLIRTTAIAILSLPLVAMAQTTPSTGSSKLQNAETPRSNLEKQQTEQQGDALKYGQNGTASSNQMNRKDSSKMHKMKKPKKTDGTAPGTDTTTPK
jgi:hypothetical protein